MRRLFPLNNVKKVGFLIALGVEIQAFGGDFQYFNSKIDFWNEKKTVNQNSQKNEIIPASKSVKDETPSSFSWQTYLDPKNKEFFKEGDYTPPEPFMELVKNPTDANLKNWFAYIDKKNELTERLQKRMQEYLIKNRAVVETSGRETMNQRLTSLPMTAPDAKRYRFRMYFDSHCPHCKKMFETLSELQTRGFYVEAKQVDSDPRGMEGTGIPTSRVAAGEVQAKDIQSVPVLLVGDLQRKAVYRLTGYQSTKSVIEAIQNAAH